MRTYAPFTNAPFDREHLTAMESAYDLVSRDFGLEPHERALRKWVESAILECAQRGIKNRLELRKCATEILRLPSWRRPRGPSEVPS